MKSIIHWFIIPTLDFHRAVDFYNEILDTHIVVQKDLNGDNIGFFIDPDTPWINGVLDSRKDHKPCDDGIEIFLNVDGMLEEVLSRVVWAWWMILKEKTNLWAWWFMAVIKDTEWNKIWLHSV